ncbi:hypothetical protein ACYOEI_09905 [Singulisphaera rosea]
MNGRIFVARRDDLDAWQELGRAVQEWEPTLEPYILPPHAQLFEPDGTLYAIALSANHSVSHNRRVRSIGLGDMIVIPRGLAFDVEPEVRMLGIRHDGPQPIHFRERFIQVWGFEHVPIPRTESEASVKGNMAEVIPTSDVRHRLIYDVWNSSGGCSDTFTTEFNVVLLIGLTEETRVLPAEGESTELAPGDCVAIGPGRGYRLEGRGSLARVTLSTEMAQQSQIQKYQATVDASLSPEYRPAPPLEPDDPTECSGQK